MMEKYEWKTAKGAKVEIEVSQEHTDFEDVQTATDFERVLAEFIYCVRNQDVEPEPLAYGRATNTEIIGYIETDKVSDGCGCSCAECTCEECSLLDAYTDELCEKGGR